jgi:hypothetical protein
MRAHRDNEREIMRREMIVKWRSFYDKKIKAFIALKYITIFKPTS